MLPEPLNITRKVNLAGVFISKSCIVDAAKPSLVNFSNF